MDVVKPWLPSILDINSSAFQWSGVRILVIAAVLIVSSVGGGLFPALLVTKAMGITALKGRLTSSGKGLVLRRGLVLCQFLCSAGFIIFAFTVSRQMNFLISLKTGMDLKHRIAVRSVGTEDFDFQKFRTFKNALRGNAFISNISASSVRPGDIGGGNSAFSLSGDPEVQLYTVYSQVDYGYFTTMDIPIIAGEQFQEGKSYGFEGKGERSIVISKDLVTQFGWSSPQEALGKSLHYDHVFDDIHLKIIGVSDNVSEYFQGSIRKDRIYMFANTAHPYARYNHYLVALRGDLQEGLKVVEDEWRRAFPGSTFEYTFMEQAFNEQMADDIRIGHLSDLSAVLTVVIATLGLLGLVSFTTAQRTKEVGIRKALGATTQQIVFLLSWDFLRIILLAIIVAIPLVGLVANEFLADYEYRIELSYLFFLLPGLLLLSIAWLTVSIQTTRAARANPVDSLRYE